MLNGLEKSKKARLFNSEIKETTKVITMEDGITKMEVTITNGVTMVVTIMKVKELFLNKIKMIINQTKIKMIKERISHCNQEENQKLEEKGIVDLKQIKKK